jgi:diguanylate cyclase (GGDEF)-like protein/PAS domain S-box-containing protein
MDAERLEACLRVHTDRLVEALQAEPFSADPAHEVGVALVDAHFTDTATLGQTIAALSTLPAALGCPPDDGLDDRIRRLQGALAAGYAAALQRCTFNEQEHIRLAAMRSKTRAEEALRESEARFRTLFAGAPIGIAVGGVDGRILEVNHALERMLGSTADELRRRTLCDLISDDTNGLRAAYKRLARGECESFRAENRYVRSDGDAIWTDLAVSLIRTEHGEPQYQVAMLQDITERHRLQTRLQYHASHDPLTRLPNRTVFDERLEQALRNTDRRARIAICYLDLDGFKLINDGVGHDIGDQLLTAIGERLAMVAAAQGCLIARLGGDEFVVLATDTAGVETAIDIAERLLLAFARPFEAGDHELTVSASIGVVERRVAGTNATELLRAADITLQWAKADGKGRWALFDRERNARTMTARSLSAAMPRALERGEFVVEYQPIVRLASAELLAAEALVRWRHPQRGVLPPEQFIPLAEETGLIVPLGMWVLEAACREAASWQARTGERPVMVSVNVAAQQILEPGLVDHVTRIVRESGLDPALLQLELTESAIMSSAGSPLDVLHALADLGVAIAIDDLGTGYSNLSYLRSLPLTGIKLAGSFVEGIDGRSDDSVDEQIVGTLVALARILRLTVTAEGVETLSQAQRLRQVGCDAGQGAFFGVAGPPQMLWRRTNGAT